MIVLAITRLGSHMKVMGSEKVFFQRFLGQEEPYLKLTCNFIVTAVVEPRREPAAGKPDMHPPKHQRNR